MFTIQIGWNLFICTKLLKSVYDEEGLLLVKDYEGFGNYNVKIYYGPFSSNVPE